MRLWVRALLFVALQSTGTASSASDASYYWCPVNDTRFPTPNIRITTSWFGSQVIHVLEGGSWVKKKSLSDNELIVEYSDEWGKTSAITCKNEAFKSHCPTRKSINLAVIGSQEGVDLLLMSEYAGSDCCFGGVEKRAGTWLGNLPCTVSRVAR